MEYEKLPKNNLIIFEDHAEKAFYRRKKTIAVKEMNDILREVDNIDSSINSLQTQRCAKINSLSCINVKVKRLNRRIAGETDARS